MSFYYRVQDIRSIKDRNRAILCLMKISADRNRALPGRQDAIRALQPFLARIDVRTHLAYLARSTSPTIRATVIDTVQESRKYWNSFGSLVTDSLRDKFPEVRVAAFDALCKSFADRKKSALRVQEIQNHLDWLSKQDISAFEFSETFESLKPCPVPIDPGILAKIDQLLTAQLARLPSLVRSNDFWNITQVLTHLIGVEATLSLLTTHECWAEILRLNTPPRVTTLPAKAIPFVRFATHPGWGPLILKQLRTLLGQAQSDLIEQVLSGDLPDPSLWEEVLFRMGRDPALQGQILKDLPEDIGWSRHSPRLDRGRFDWLQPFPTNLLRIHLDKILVWIDQTRDVKIKAKADPLLLRLLEE